MSAFLVDDQTINRIVTWIRYELDGSRYTPVGPLAEQYEVDVESEGWETALATLMLELNERGMHARYGDMLTFRVRVFEPADASPIQVFKSLKCFLYQCTEGEVSHLPLYRFFEDISDVLANALVIALPAYEQAEWG